MYDFIDRPVARLSFGGRFLLWAMRGWVVTASAGKCPPGALAPAFARHGALPALPHFHCVLGELNHRALRTVSLAPLGHCFIVDDEAVLLQLWRNASAAPPRAQETLALILQPAAVGEAFSALLSTCARLADIGLGEVVMEADGVRG